MEFLVEIDVHWPPEADRDRRDALIREEVERAAELAAAGKLKRLWRVPGRWANIGLWEASDATELHTLLAALPFYPWLDIVVRPLARHPSDPPAMIQPERDRHAS
jgi:muconolactone D-isomerase